MIEKDFDNNNENCVEFLTGERRAGFTFTQRKYKNRILELAEKYPDKVDFVVNEDDSIFGHVPISWVKINPPRNMNMTEEQRAAAAERMKHIRDKRK